MGHAFQGAFRRGADLDGADPVIGYGVIYPRHETGKEASLGEGKRHIDGYVAGDERPVEKHSRTGINREGAADLLFEILLDGVPVVEVYRSLDGGIEASVGELCVAGVLPAAAGVFRIRILVGGVAGLAGHGAEVVLEEDRSSERCRLVAEIHAQGPYIVDIEPDRCPGMGFEEVGELAVSLGDGFRGVRSLLREGGLLGRQTVGKAELVRRREISRDGSHVRLLRPEYHPSALGKGRIQEILAHLRVVA